jgi:preprotein translocase subunit SecF
MELLKNPNFDFIGKTRFWLTVSAVALALAIGLMATRGLKYGVEFSGGTQLIARFQSSPSIDEIRNAVKGVDPEAVLQTYDDPAKNQVLIRLAQAGADNEITGPAQNVLAALSRSYPQNPVVESSSEIVGPVVGSELRRTAVTLTVLGLVAQLIYIAVRFKGAQWGTAATVGVFHDVLLTMGVLVLTGYEITLNVIAALLTLVGYSVNDTIVVFDRVRENMKQHRKDSFPKILNDALNQTLSRTIITAGTTFLVVLGLYLFRGSVMRGFAFTMLVGIVLGTYSSLYVATPLVAWWQSRQDKQKA